MSRDPSSFSTPLVRLSRFAPNGAVFVKAEHLQPNGSVFDRVARSLLEERVGELGRNGVAIVAGSGSLCLSFAAEASRFPIELVCVCPASTLPEHRKLLASHRVTVVLSDASLGLRGAHARALEEQVSRQGVLLPSPLESDAVARVFEA